MNIEHLLRDSLSSMSAVTDLVSTRIWDEWFRSATVPAIVFEIDSEEPQNDIRGTGSAVFGDINIICRADTRKGSRELAEAVRTNNTNPGTGLAGLNNGYFTAILDYRMPSATPKSEGSNDYWYDTNMGFTIAWLEDV